MSDPSPDVVPIAVADGVEVIGEWSRTDDRRAVVLALHDRDHDLDRVRPFARQLARLGIDTLMVDLPGHGLSAGQWDDHGPAAVEAALAVCRNDNPLVSVLAVGAATGLVLACEAEVCSLVAIAPQIDVALLGDDTRWRTTPTLTASDPSNEASQTAQKAIAKWIRAWHLQVHGAFGSDDGELHGVWRSQLTTAAAAFAAEQFAYRNNDRRAGDARQGDRPDGP